MADIAACLSSGKDDWETPDELFNLYHQRYHFTIDGAANETNHKLPHWWGPGGLVEDALTINWADYTSGPVWLNPPYSRELQAPFVKKAAKAGLVVVCLLPARTDTKLFHEVIFPLVGGVTFLKGRIKFKGAAQGAPFPSMVVVFGGKNGS